MLLFGLYFVTAGGCTSWCHWDDANCEKEECEDCPRCKQLDGAPTGQPALVQKSTIAPNDPLLEYSGFVHLEVTSELATFDRLYSDTFDRNPAAKENPGARIRWRTDAQRVIVNLDYRKQCDELCPIDINRGCYARHVCYCHCRARLFVNGDQQELYSRIRADGRYGPGKFELPVVKYREAPELHEYLMVLPWCAAVAFRGITLESEEGAPTPQLVALPPSPPRLRYVAWGDSITHGWCGNETYPEQIARLNQWEPFNVAIQGMTMDDGGLGHAIADLKGDLYTFMIGANDCTNGGLGGYGRRMGEMLRIVRVAQPQAVLAVLTPVEFGSCGIEPFREALRKLVDGLSADSGIVLLEGRQLIPRSDFIERGNPHPNPAGMVEMGMNLNAELGFSQTRYQLLGCQPALSLRVQLQPNRAFVVYSGPSVDVTHRQATRLGNTASCQPCCRRSFMVLPQSSVRGKTDDEGRATVILKGSCDATSWQVIDLATCHPRCNHIEPKRTPRICHCDRRRCNLHLAAAWVVLRHSTARSEPQRQPWRCVRAQSACRPVHRPSKLDHSTQHRRHNTPRWMLTRSGGLESIRHRDRHRLPSRSHSPA